MNTWYTAQDGLNVQLTLWVYQLGHFGMVGLFRVLDAIGTHYAFPIYGLAIFAIHAWKILHLKQQRRPISDWVKYFAAFYVALIISFMVEALSVDYIKEMAAHARPYIAFPEIVTPILGEQPAKEAYRSFPSGHASFTAFIIVACWPLLNEKLKLPALGYLLLMLWFRVASGEHYLADVLVGASIGALFGLTLPRFIRNRLHKWLRIPLSLHAKPDVTSS